MHFTRVALLCAFSPLAVAFSAAQDPQLKETVELKRKALEEPFPNLGLLYKDEDSSFLNEVWFLGRYHGQNHWAESSNGHEDEG